MAFFSIFLSGCSYKKCGDEYIGLKSPITIEIFMNNKFPAYPQMSIRDQIKNIIMSSVGGGLGDIRKYLIKNGFSCDNLTNHCVLVENFTSRPQKKCTDREYVEYKSKIEIDVFIGKNGSKNKIDVSCKIYDLN